MGSCIAGLLAIWALAAAAFDWRQRRVPNLLLLVVAVPAVLAFAVLRHGLLGSGIGSSLAGLFIGTLPWLPGYALGMVGAGDVKLSGLQGFLLGAAGSAMAFLVGAVTLGFIALFTRLLRPQSVQPSRLPAAVAIAVGFLWVVIGNFPLPGWGQ
jgi:prepilin peptidase CpaA